MNHEAAAWSEATRLVARWLDRRERIDELMEKLPPSFTGAERARCQYLVYGVVRHHGRLAALLKRLIPHPPRTILRAVLYVAGYELIATGLTSKEPDGAPMDGMTAKIVHHAVERAKSLASPAEARLVNAVTRRLSEALAGQSGPPRLAPASALAEYFSHPEWLVSRWLAQFGAEATRSLLEWNQQPAPVYARWRADAPAPEWLGATRWPSFFEMPPGRWSEVEPLIASTRLYLQDPSTRRAVEILAPAAGEDVLDLCASPGGKTLQLSDAMRRGRVVAVDMPGERQKRLSENASRAHGVEIAVVATNIEHALEPALRERSLPLAYPAVLLDAPCSNTGVMRRRADLKWRLQEGDFARHAHQQLALLNAAAGHVAPGGRLVYSTCSIDPEENERVVAAFLRKHKTAFVLEIQELGLPWESGCDGMGAFLLRRKE